MTYRDCDVEPRLGLIEAVELCNKRKTSREEARRRLYDEDKPLFDLLMNQEALSLLKEALSRL